MSICVSAFAYFTGTESLGFAAEFAAKREAQCTELYAALRDVARHCNSALSLSFLLRILSGAAKAPWRPAPERIRSKNERLSAQSFTRRYEMVRNTVTDRAPRAFKEQALGSRRAERASPEKADHSEQANQTPSQGACAWCARCVFFCARRASLNESCGALLAGYGRLNLKFVSDVCFGCFGRFVFRTVSVTSTQGYQDVPGAAHKT